mgnify:FL=1
MPLQTTFFVKQLFVERYSITTSFFRHRFAFFVKITSPASRDVNEFDHRIVALLLRQRERPEKFGLNLNGDSNYDLCDPSAVLRQLSFQAKWEQVVMWVDYKSVDVEIDDDITRIFHVSEM